MSVKATTTVSTSSASTIRRSRSRLSGAVLSLIRGSCQCGPRDSADGGWRWCGRACAGRLLDNLLGEPTYRSGVEDLRCGLGAVPLGDVPHEVLAPADEPHQ